MHRRKPYPPLLCKSVPGSEEPFPARNETTAQNFQLSNRYPREPTRLWVDRGHENQYLAAKQGCRSPVVRAPPPVVPLTPVRKSKVLGQRHYNTAYGQRQSIEQSFLRKQDSTFQYDTTLETSDRVFRVFSEASFEREMKPTEHRTLHRSVSLTQNLDKVEYRLNKSEGIFVTSAQSDRPLVRGVSLSRSLSINTAGTGSQTLPTKPAFTLRRSTSVNVAQTPKVHTVATKSSFPGRSLTGSASRKRAKRAEVTEEDKTETGSVKEAVEGGERRRRRCSGLMCWLPLVVLLLLGTLFVAQDTTLQSRVLQEGKATFARRTRVLSVNTTGLSDHFHSMVIGQQPVTDFLPQIIVDYVSDDAARNPLVLSFHGWIGTGKTFVADILMEGLFKKQGLGKCAHRFISSFDFPRGDESDRYITGIKQVINGTVLSQCRVRLVVFDEADAIPPSMIPPLVALFSDAAPQDVGKAIYILESNLFGQEINQYTMHHLLQGGSLETLTVFQIVDFVRNTDARKIDLAQPNQDHDFDSRKALHNHKQLEPVIDHVVPFLPLTSDAVKRCIRRDLAQKGRLVSDSTVDKIADQLQFFPANLKLFSVSGCKKVSSNVDLIVG